MKISRRDLLKTAGSASVLASASPGLVFAAAPTNKRFVTIILRGGMDALTAVAPYADPNYARLRSFLSLGKPGETNGAIDLNGYFGLDPRLTALAPLYKKGELAILHAATTNYRGRSHFDGQNVLENGTPKPYGVDSGWLNRSLALMNAGEQRIGLSVGHAVPLMMRGKTDVQTWAPSALPKAEGDFLDRLMRVYESDPVFEHALKQAMKSAALSAGVTDGMGKVNARSTSLKIMAEAAGKLLTKSNGPRVAVIESGGWDTHAGQHLLLTNKLKELNEGLEALQQHLGEAWRETVIVVVSEFGRTVAANGTRGTDHGTGGLAFILGGSVKGGQIIGKWPGLDEKHQFQGRDLAPVNDYRSLFKTVLHEHLGLDEGKIEDAIFPDSRTAQMFSGLIRKV
tara:strand:- start:1590 stop:2783 length:1194 start_codon:yes stop_codon:yes gene_type:complete